MDFALESFTIPKGATVIWTNQGQIFHTATSSANSQKVWDTGVLIQGRSSTAVTFNTPGTFPYFCQVHGAASMSGTITVTG